MTAPAASGRPRLWEQKNPFIAGILAWLIPGAGHFYQGRTVKGVIYLVCIWGLYFGGMRLGEGQVIYQNPAAKGRNRLTLSLMAQLGVGFPTVLTFVQTARAEADNNRTQWRLEEPLVAPFEGTLIGTGPGQLEGSGHLSGTVELQPTEDDLTNETRGKFIGTLNNKPVELELNGGFELERPIAAGQKRRLQISVVPTGNDHPQLTQLIRGTIPRSVVDGFVAPPDPDSLRELNFRLAKTYDLALVFTWIAGLLNVLAIWDCVQGPAYGFGDEEDEDATDTDQKTPVPASEPVTPVAT